MVMIGYLFFILFLSLTGIFGNEKIYCDGPGACNYEGNAENITYICSNDDICNCGSAEYCYCLNNGDCNCQSAGYCHCESNTGSCNCDQSTTCVSSLEEPALKRDVSQAITIQILSPTKASYFNTVNSISVKYTISASGAAGSDKVDFCLKNYFDTSYSQCVQDTFQNVVPSTVNTKAITITVAPNPSAMYYVQVKLTTTATTGIKETPAFKIGVTPQLAVGSPQSSDIYGVGAIIQSNWYYDVALDNTQSANVSLNYWDPVTADLTSVQSTTLLLSDNTFSFPAVEQTWASSQYYFVLVEYPCGSQTCFEQSPFFTVSLTAPVPDITVVSPTLGSIIASSPQVTWTTSQSISVNIQLMQDVYPVPIVVEEHLAVSSSSTSVNSNSFTTPAAGQYYFRIEYGCTASRSFCFSRESPFFTIGTSGITFQSPLSGNKYTPGTSFSAQWTIASSPTKMAINLMEQRPVIEGAILESISAVVTENSYSTQTMFGSPFPVYFQVSWNCLLWTPLNGYYCTSKGVSPVFAVPLLVNNKLNYYDGGSAEDYIYIIDYTAWCGLGPPVNEQYCGMHAQTGIGCQDCYFTSRADVTNLNFTINQGVVTYTNIHITGITQFSYDYRLVGDGNYFSWSFEFPYDYAETIDRTLSQFTIGGVPLSLQIIGSVNATFNVTHKGTGRLDFGLNGKYTWDLDITLSGNTPSVIASFAWGPDTTVNAFDKGNYVTTSDIYADISLKPWTQVILHKVIDVSVNHDTHVILNAKYGNFASKGSPNIKPAILQTGGCNVPHSFEYDTSSYVNWYTTIVSPIKNLGHSESLTSQTLESGCLDALLPPPTPEIPPEVIEPTPNPTSDNPPDPTPEVPTPSSPKPKPQTGDAAQRMAHSLLILLSLISGWWLFS